MRIIQEPRYTVRYNTKEEERANRRYVVKCDNCKCKIEYLRKEIKDHLVGCNDPWLEYYIVCPSCRHRVRHSMFNRRRRVKK